MTNAFDTWRSRVNVKSEVERERDGDGNTMRLLRATAAGTMFLSTFVLCLALAPASRCYAQTGDQASAPTKVAELNDPEKAASDGSATVGTTPTAPPTPAVAVS